MPPSPCLDPIHVYTDGSISKNPGGFGSYAAIVLSQDIDLMRVTELCGCEENTTNNRMELRGALLGLLSIEEPEHVIVHSDSQYVVRGMNEWIKDWVALGTLSQKTNADLWEVLLAARRRHLSVTFEWVRGHAEDFWNNEVDRLAGEMMRKADPAHFHYLAYSYEIPRA